MKRIVVFLAILSLVAGSVKATCYAAEGDDPAATGKVISGEVASDAVTAGKTVWLGENQLPSYLEVGNMLLRRGQKAAATISYSGEPQWPEDNVLGWYFLTYDYAHGVTEAEADKLVREFRGEAKSWVTNMAKYTSIMDSGSFGGTLGFEDDEALTTKNRSGILYYALELGSLAQQAAGETVWLQGKLNYRGCLHDFWELPEGRTASCVARKVGDTGIVLENSERLAEGVPTPNESLVSWVEEWSELLLDEVRGLGNKFETAKNGEDETVDVGELAQKTTTRLTEIASFASKTVNEAALRAEIKTVTEGIEKWQAGQAPVVRPSNPVVSGSQTGPTGNSDTDVADDKKTEDDLTDTAGKGDAEQETGATKQPGGLGQAGQQTTGAATGQTEHTERGEVEAKDKLEETEKDNQQEQAGDTDGEEVNIPRLGGAESRWNIWPLIIAGVSMLGVAGWCGKKWYDSHR